MDVKTFGTSLETLLHRFENPRLGLGLIWLMARCGDKKGVSIRAAELATVLGVSKVWACRILNDLLKEGFIENCKQGVNSGVNLDSFWLDKRARKYDISIRYDNVFKVNNQVINFEAGVNSGVNKPETKSPCDVGEVVELPKKRSAKKVDGVDQFIAAYLEAFKARFQRSAHIGGIEAGSARNIVKDLGLVKAIDLIPSYFLMRHSRFVDEEWSLPTMKRNLHKIVGYHETGRFTTRTSAIQVDKTMTNGQALEEFLEEDRRREACSQSV